MTPLIDRWTFPVYEGWYAVAELTYNGAPIDGPYRARAFGDTPEEALELVEQMIPGIILQAKTEGAI